MLGVGAAAALAGAGVATWRWRAQPVLDPALQAFWAERFEQPGGGELSVASFRGKPLLVNFWATWCPPCVDELPLINRFYRDQAANGWQVLGLAVDQAAPVTRFLAHTPLDFSVALAGFAGTELSRSLGNASGALPFSVVFAADGTVRHRKLGKVDPEELALWAKNA